MRSRSLLGVLVAALLFAGASDATALISPPAPAVDVPPPASWPDAPADAVSAEAYVLLEAATGQVLAARAADEARPVASTIKILTAITVLDRTELTDEVTVGDEVLDVPGAAVGLRPGDTWTVEQLLDAVIVRSGNEAAEALAVHVAGDRDAFVELMRRDAAALGLDIALVSPSGLDDDNLLSARDLGTIARAALADDRLRPILARQRVLLPSTGIIETRNLLLDRYPGATGVKTGFTAAAGNSVVGSAKRGERELIAVVLGSDEDPARFDEAALLLDLGFEAYQPTELGASLAFSVAGGSVVLDVDTVRLSIPDGSDAELRLPLTARPPEADVDIEVTVDEEVYGTVTGVLDTSGGPSPATGEAALSRAAVDGAYAALRAATATGVLR